MRLPSIKRVHLYIDRAHHVYKSACPRVHGENTHFQIDTHTHTRARLRLARARSDTRARTNTLAIALRGAQEFRALPLPHARSRYVMYI